MKNLLYNPAIYVIFLGILLIPIFYVFSYHTIFSGVDELRMTLVPAEMAKSNSIFFASKNNMLFHTNIFVKEGFLINNNNVLYPNGFILNSLMLVPLQTITGMNPITINAFFLCIYLFSYITMYLILRKLNLGVFGAVCGAFAFSLVNYNLGLYVSYFPDAILIFFVLLFIYLCQIYIEKSSTPMLILIFFFASFLAAYKITMFPILFTFFPLVSFYAWKHHVSKLKLFFSILLFILLFIIGNFPTFYANKIGPSYAELAGNTNSAKDIQAKQYTTSLQAKSSSKILRIIQIFWQQFLYPKGNGSYLVGHVVKDTFFFAQNNIFVLLGFSIGITYLLKNHKKYFYLFLLLFLTSFILWGNMNIYGGSDTFHLRNSHIRYMLPIFTLFFILGFAVFEKTTRNKYILIILTIFITITSFSDLSTKYPFSSYSLINQNTYLNVNDQEKKEILALHLPQNCIFLSASFDDYDLSYYFDNYGDLKRLATNHSLLRKTLSTIVTAGKPTYILIPKKDSSYNPFLPKDINNLTAFVKQSYQAQLIYQSYYKEIYKLSPKHV